MERARGGAGRRERAGGAGQQRQHQQGTPAGRRQGAENPWASSAHSLHSRYNRAGTPESCYAAGKTLRPGRLRLGNLDVPDFDYLGAGGDEGRQQCRRLVAIAGLDPPEQAMPAGEAGAGGRPPPQGAVEAPPGRESGGALGRGMAVMEVEERHGPILGRHGAANIGGDPLTGGSVELAPEAISGAGEGQVGDAGNDDQGQHQRRRPHLVEGRARRRQGGRAARRC